MRVRSSAKRGEVVVLDVRPPQEYETAHLPYARSMPLAELARRLSELPRDVEIVAYCRGPFCLMSDEAVALIAEVGWDPAFGARPLKRAIQRLVENPLALELLEGRFGEGDTVRAVVDGETIRFEAARAAAPAAA